MDYLTELVGFLDQRGKLTHVLNDVLARQPHTKELLLHLRKFKETDSELASKKVFGSKGDARLAKTKTLLKSHLINGILIKGIGKMDDRVECYRLFVAGYMLWASGGRELSIPLIESAFKKAERSQMLEIAQMAAKQLTYYYGNQNPDRKKYLFYREKKLRYDHLLRCYNFINDLYNAETLWPSLKIDGLPSSELKRELEHFDEMAADVTLPIKTEYMRLILAVEVMVAENKADSNEIEALLSSKSSFFSKNATIYRAFLQHLMVLSILQCKKESGFDLLNKLDALIEPELKLMLWVNVRMLEVYLNTYLKDYEAAIRTMDRIIDKGVVDKLPSEQREQFLLSQMLLTFVGDREAHHQLVNRWNLRLRRFLNEMEKISNDKAGNNVMVYIAEILWHVIKSNYGKADNRLEALSRYLTRHKVRNMHPRHYRLARMLMVASEANYHRVATIRKNEANLIKLISAKPKKTSHHSIETVPMEHLWESFLRNLDAKRN